MSLDVSSPRSEGKEGCEEHLGQMGHGRRVRHGVIRGGWGVGLMVSQYNGHREQRLGRQGQAGVQGQA